MNTISDWLRQLRTDAHGFAGIQGIRPDTIGKRIACVINWRKPCFGAGVVNGLISFSSIAWVKECWRLCQRLHVVNQIPKPPATSITPPVI